jgi:hypothetical protein
MFWNTDDKLKWEGSKHINQWTNHLIKHVCNQHKWVILNLLSNHFTYTSNRTSVCVCVCVTCTLYQRMFQTKFIDCNGKFMQPNANTFLFVLNIMIINLIQFYSHQKATIMIIASVVNDHPLLWCMFDATQKRSGWVILKMHASVFCFRSNVWELFLYTSTFKTPQR